MNAFFESIANDSITYSIGMALVHFLWQATLVAIVFAAVRKLQRQYSSQTRYLTALLGLLVLVALPLMTFFVVNHNSQLDQAFVSTVPQGSNFSQSATSEFVSNPEVASGNHINDNGTAVTQPFPGDSAAGTYLSPPRASYLNASLPWLVVLWSAGVVILALQLMLGLNRIRSWRQSATVVSSKTMIKIRDRLCQRMHLKRPVQLLESFQAVSPIVISWVRPAILIPANVVTGLTPRELETILAHELAHIHRHDYLVNLAQAIIETILFYHPAVWWMSNCVREEREHCCDDMAVEICGDRKILVHALAKLEEFRCHDFQVAVAASDGSLIKRMTRILDGPQPRRHSVWPAGLVAFASVVCLAVTLLVSTGNSVAMANSTVSNSGVGDAIAKDISAEDQLQSAVFATIEESLNASFNQTQEMNDRQETNSVNPDEKAKQQNYVAAASGDQDWGPAPEQGNLRLRLTLKSNEVKEGLPVLASLELKNFGNDVESYNWQDFRTNGPLIVKNVDGDYDQYIASPFSTQGNLRQLQPGESVFIWKDFDVGTAYLLDQGQYSVQVIGYVPRRGDKTIPESNIQTLRISKGQQTPRKRFIRSLIARSPNWWNVTYNSYGMSASYNAYADKRAKDVLPKTKEPGDTTKADDHSAEKPAAAGEADSRLPTEKSPDGSDFGDLKKTEILKMLSLAKKRVSLGKIAPPQIGFKFTPEPLPAEDIGKNLTPLGNTELGYLYVRSNEKITELWPDHIAKIREAAKSIKK